MSAASAAEVPGGGRRWVAAHGALVVLTGLALLLPGGAPWPLTGPANLLLPLAVPAPLLLVACVRRRARVAALAQAGATAVALALVAEPAWRSLAREGPSGDGPDLTVLALNLGVGLAEADDVAALCERERPDLVVLLELTRGVAAELSARLAEAYPHRAFHPGGVDGKGVLSRHPILSEELFALEQGRPYLRCRVRVDGREVELVALHLAPSIGLLGSASAAGRDLAAIAASLDPRGASLLVGDFNSTQRSGAHARLERRGFREAFDAAGRGFGFTFPVFGRYFGLPVGRFLRVDQVWFGAGLAAASARAGPDVGSDHLPLRADLRFAD